MKPRCTLRRALNDPNLLGRAICGDTWQPWRTLLIAAMGEELTDAERITFTQLTNRDQEPGQRVEEFVGVIGRRGGKSRAISVLATFIAGLCQHPSLVPGERGVVLVIAPDQKQSSITLDYIEANFRTSPILTQLVESRTARSLKLSNRIDIEVRASDFRTLRGPTYVAVIADESAFWMTENSTNPDTEILNSVRPGLATTGGSLIMISSPYARRGELWSLYNKHFGANGDPLILVAQGTSRTFNPSLPQSVVDRAIERDPASAAAEYGAEFRRDLESYVSLDVVERCIGDFFEIAPSYQRSYQCFVDPAGGSGQDSFAAAISHKDNDSVVIDVVREIRPPFSPEAAITEIATLAKNYHCFTVTGDRFAGGFPPEVFNRTGLTYEPAQLPKSDLFNVMLPLLNSGKIVLPKNTRLINQIVSLERQVGRSGKDSISHPPNGHDDVANAVAGAAELAFHRGFDMAQWKAAWG